MKHTLYLRWGLSLLAFSALFYLSSCNGGSKQYGCPNKLQASSILSIPGH